MKKPASTEPTEDSDQFQSYLEPQRVLSGERVQLTIENRLDSSETFIIKLEDKTGPIDQKEFVISPHEKRTIRFRPTVPPTSLIDFSKTHPYTISVITNGDIQLHRLDILRQSQISFTWLRFILLSTVGMIFGGCAVFTLLWFYQESFDNNSIDPTLVVAKALTTTPIPTLGPVETLSYSPTVPATATIGIPTVIILPNLKGTGVAEVATAPGVATTPTAQVQATQQAISAQATAQSDTDSDGLTFAQEESIGTNPLSTDSDSDGLSDGFEYNEWGSNPTQFDTDGDQLNDLEEWDLGTNPLAVDTDGDGLNDGVELNSSTSDPLLYDTDGDELNDLEEWNLGTDPLKRDSDGDGINDNDEVSAKTDPVDPPSTQEEEPIDPGFIPYEIPPVTITFINKTQQLRVIFIDRESLLRLYPGKRGVITVSYGFHRVDDCSVGEAPPCGPEGELGFDFDEDTTWTITTPSPTKGY